jgi:hypothetical protein
MVDKEHTYVVGASTYPGSDKDELDGIYFGHAYAVVGVAFPPVSCAATGRAAPLS